jgi:hypothetical protein
VKFNEHDVFYFPLNYTTVEVKQIPVHHLLHEDDREYGIFIDTATPSHRFTSAKPTNDRFGRNVIQLTFQNCLVLWDLDQNREVGTLSDHTQFMTHGNFLNCGFTLYPTDSS